MIFENTNEVDLVNKLLSELPGVPATMKVEEFNTVQDILRKASASFINRTDRDASW